MNTPPHPEKIPPSLSEKGFVAGTLVHTSRGLVPIQDIRVGDMVLSRPADGSGEIAYKPVVRTMKSAEKKTIYSVYYTNDSDCLMNGINYERRDYVLFCTEEHPFMVGPNPSRAEYMESEDVKWEWTAIREARDYNGLVNIAGDNRVFIINEPSPVRVLPNFPPGFAYTQGDDDAREDDVGLGRGISFVYFDPNGYKIVCNSHEKENKYHEIMESLVINCKLHAKEPMLDDKEVMDTLVVRLKQDLQGRISYYYPNNYPDMPPDKSQLIAKYGSMQGLGFPAWKGLDPTKIFYEDGSPAYDENGLPRDPDDWFSIHLHGEGENVYQDYVYNIEVADWHTYFVGLEGIWVHNCGGADMAHP